MRTLHATERATWSADAVEAGIAVHAGTDAGGYVAHGRVADEVAAMAELIGAREALYAASHSARDWLGLPGLRHRRRRRSGASTPRTRVADLGGAAAPVGDHPGRAGSRVGRAGLIDRVTEWSGHGCRPAPLSGRGRHWCVRTRCPTRSRRRPPSKTARSTPPPWLSRSSSPVSARSASRSTASSSPTPAPAAAAGPSRTSASTTRRPTPASSRSTPTARSTGSASARSRPSPCCRSSR